MVPLHCLTKGTNKMTKNEELSRAIKIAVEAHENQWRWNGTPYIIHPINVMNKVKTPDEKIIAILHDVLEDSKFTEDQLLNAGLDQRNVMILGFYLTRTKDIEYTNYIQNIYNGNCSEAVNVKLADLEDNLNLLSPNNIGGKYLTEYRVKTFEKYLHAYHKLSQKV